MDDKLSGTIKCISIQEYDNRIIFKKYIKYTRYERLIIEKLNSLYEKSVNTNDEIDIEKCCDFFDDISFISKLKYNSYEELYPNGFFIKGI